jgi:ADP-heptose:LPS heptosyltransferase
LTSTSCKQVAETALAQCVAGQPPRELPWSLLQEPCAQALFGTLVEGLADRFEPALCDVYTRLFSQALCHADSTLDVMSLVARYERVRRPRPVAGRPQRVFVLSRVTLGADVAITSILLAAAKRRFPSAEIVFVGPGKNQELFAGDPQIQHAPLEYRRGSLTDRLAAAGELKQLVGQPGSIVIDSDSRLTQLGLFPVCAEENYYFFESRAYGGSSDRSLPELTADWAWETFSIRDAKPYVSLARVPEKTPAIAVSLGVGENPAKRIPDPFEAELLKELSETGLSLAIDKGAGGAEAERVERAIAASGVEASVWDGSFAGFAEIIASSRLYLGYDSAGQHVAAACGVPLVSIFAGFPVPRMFARWRPSGEGSTVIQVDRPDAHETLGRVREALAAVLGPPVTRPAARRG